MPVSVVFEGVPGDLKAFQVVQCWIASTTKQRVGTMGLSGCMGVVVHSPTFKRGAVAHIQAENPDYQAVFEHFVERMVELSEISEDNSREIALFGNASGNADLSASMRTFLLSSGFTSDKIIDCRSSVMGTKLMDQVRPRPEGLAKMIGGLVYDPDAGQIFVVASFTAVERGAGTLEQRLQKKDGSISVGARSAKSCIII